MGGDLLLHIRGDTITTIYNELLDLRPLGRLSITRASRVEPDQDGRWWADMGQVSLGSFEYRSQALAAEVDWLKKNLGGRILEEL